MFLMSRIGVLNANSQCHLMESSIGGMYLRGHVFKTYRDQLPKECYFRCEEEVTCQSYNVVIGQNICELNNRTKEARPEDFMPDQMRFYMKRSRNRGTLYVPSTNLFAFLGKLVFWIFHSRFKKLKYQRNKIYRFRYIPMASLLMIQFRGLFQYW